MSPHPWPYQPLGRARAPGRYRWHALLLAACLAGVMLAGCAQPADTPANTFATTETIEADAFFEVNLAMNDSAQLNYRWQTVDGAELAFDVHSHTAPGEVGYHDRFNDSSADGTFTAPREGAYSLLWGNSKDEPAKVEIRLEGDFELRSTIPG